MVAIPGYTIDCEIGRGGMANVYLAIQQSVERQVALKVMSPVLLVDPTFSERFMREARIAANLNHPGVVAVHDVGRHGDHHFIAMEYMSDGDLATRCSRGMAPDEALGVISEIAAALHYAHAKGFVHRDVKPENILFRDNGSAVLTDFGIARAVDSATQMTKTGAVIGTPQYMSPEQARGQDLDGRSDIYGLGIVMFEVLTGKVPYEGADSVSVGIKHVTEPVPRLPGHLSRFQPLLNRFLAKQPENRFQTGDEAVKAISEALSGAPVAEMATVAAPALPLEETRVSDPGLIIDYGPQSDSPEPKAVQPQRSMGVSATPRPDGTLRQEPSLGSIDQIKSFDRTISQPSVRRSGGRWGRVVAVIGLLVAVAAVAWWKQELWWPRLMPDAAVTRLLEQAVEAEQRGDVYGQGPQYASSLFRQALDRDPGNPAAEKGLDRVAEFLVTRARQAVNDGNPRQAELLLERAREYSPSVAARAVLDSGVDPGQPDPTPGLPAVDSEAQQLQDLLADALQFVAQGRLVGSDGENAAARFRRMLEIDPDSEAAQAGLSRIRSTVRQQFEAAVAAEDTGAARARMVELQAVGVDPVELSGYREALARLVKQAEQRDHAAEQRRHRIAGLLQLAETALSEDRLGSPSGDNAITHFRAILDEDPGNQDARDGLSRVAQRYLVLAEQALEADRLEQAGNYISAIQSLQPGLSGLDRARRRLALYQEQRDRNTLAPDQVQQLGTLLTQAQAALARDELLAPPGQSAFDLYKAGLRLDPRNAEALDGLRRVSGRLIDRSRQALGRQDLELAHAWLGDARQTDPQNPMLEPLQQDIAQALRRAVDRAIDEGRLGDADQMLRRASDLEPEHPDLARIQLRLNIARE